MTTNFYFALNFKEQFSIERYVYQKVISIYIHFIYKNEIKAATRDYF